MYLPLNHPNDAIPGTILKGTAIIAIWRLYYFVTEIDK